MWFPDRKVWAGGLAGIAAWVLVMVAHRYGVEIDLGTASMLVAAIGGLVSYVVPPAQRDIIKRLNDKLVAEAAADPTIPVSPTTTVAPVTTKVAGPGGLY